MVCAYRIIDAGLISKTVARLCIEANTALRADVLAVLQKSCRTESNTRARRLLHVIIENARMARERRLAICQDTGMPAVFVAIGQDVHVNGTLAQAISRGVEAGYRQGSLRSSIIGDPLRRGRPAYRPPVVHYDIVPGRHVRLTVLPKGFGCENKSQLKMLNPTSGMGAIIDFVVSAVAQAGPDACPPYIVGVGIGGTAEMAQFLAKKALLQKVVPMSRRPKSAPGRLASDLLKKINALGIGPMGLGGKTTCLGVNIETFPTHIAGLPVAVSISCHALRSATAVL